MTRLPSIHRLRTFVCPSDCMTAPKCMVDPLLYEIPQGAVKRVAYLSCLERLRSGIVEGRVTGEMLFLAKKKKRMPDAIFPVLK